MLAQWHPFTFASKIRWKGLLIAYGLGLLSKIPGIDRVSVGDNGSFQIPGRDTILTPVVYVGSPGLKQKLVVTLVAPDNGFPIAIMKVPLTEMAWANLRQETLNLEKLAEANVPGVPTLVAVDEPNKRTWQTVVDGCLTSGKLTKAHIDWLIKLPMSDKFTTFREQKNILQHKLEQSSDSFFSYRREFSAAIKVIGEGQLPLVLVHGDFAPWNLKRQEGGNLSAVDWEDADWSGLPLWDLCHFFFMQAHLFNQQGSAEKIRNNPLIELYILKMGVDKKNLLALVLLYILFTVSGIKGLCSESYKKFLVSQIPELVFE